MKKITALMGGATKAVRGSTKALWELSIEATLC